MEMTIMKRGDSIVTRCTHNVLFNEGEKSDTTAPHDVAKGRKRCDTSHVIGRNNFVPTLPENEPLIINDWKLLTGGYLPRA